MTITNEIAALIAKQATDNANASVGVKTSANAAAWQSAYGSAVSQMVTDLMKAPPSISLSDFFKFRKNLTPLINFTESNIKNVFAKKPDGGHSGEHIANMVNPLLNLGRKSYEILVALNYRGHASRMSRADASVKADLNTRWYNLGGDTPALWQAVEAGKNKKPIICGENCKAKTKASADGMDELSVVDSAWKNNLINQWETKSGNGFNKEWKNSMYLNDGGVTEGIIASAATIIAAIAPIINKIIPSADEKAAEAAALANGENPPPTTYQDPPPSTATEDAASQAALDKLNREKTVKYIQYGAIAVAVIAAIALAFRHFRK